MTSLLTGNNVPSAVVFATLAEATGTSPSQIGLVILLLTSVPLSLVFPHLPPSPSPIPHLYAALTSILFLHLLDLDRGTFELFISSLLTWVIAKVGVKHADRLGRALPWSIFGVVMGHLAINHILVHIHRPPAEVIGIGGSQMVLVMKLSSFGWNVYDGTRPEGELDATQRSSRLTKVPDFIPFMGYCFFFPSILAGPSFTYASYASFTSHALFVKETGAIPSGKGRTLVPEGRRRKALKRLGLGLFYLAIFGLYSGKASFFKMVEPSFMKQSFAQRVLFMNVAAFIARTKYYAVWCVAESAFILSGLGYSPQTKKYDASRNVRIRSIELAPNLKIFLDSWNMNTNVWLRECIYKRVARKGRKPGFKSTQITFITSALWHGVNPCYLMTFVLAGFCQSLARALRRSLRPLVLPPLPPAPHVTHGDVPFPTGRDKPDPPRQTPLKWAYDISGILATQLAINFAVAPFMLLSVTDSWTAWKSVNFYGVWIVIVPLALLGFGGGKELHRVQKRRIAKAEKEKGVHEDEIKRREWERSQEAKRSLRGEGVASLGVDVEALVEEEEQEEKRQQQEADKKTE